MSNELLKRLHEALDPDETAVLWNDDEGDLEFMWENEQDCNVALSKSALLSDTLEVVNSARSALGLPALLEMARGKLGEALECPIAMALGDKGMYFVTGDRVMVKTEQDAEALAKAWGTFFYQADQPGDFLYVVEPPPIVPIFVRVFDDDQVPELDIINPVEA